MEERWDFACWTGMYVRASRGKTTQADVCRSLQLFGCDISEQSYSMKENGLVKFTAQEILTLSLVLGLSLDCLIKSYIEYRMGGVTK